MARYEVPTPSTLLLRLLEPAQAPAALGMLDECLPAQRRPAPAGARLCTLSDVSSAASMRPLAACLVGPECGAPNAWVARFAVAVPFRRRGLGQRMLADLGRALQSEGAERLWACVGDGRLAMRRLLAAAGYVISPAQTGSPFADDDGTGEDGPPMSWWVRDL